MTSAYGEELEGISEGSGESINNIVLMNCRYELGWISEALKKLKVEGCTFL